MFRLTMFSVCFTLAIVDGTWIGSFHDSTIGIELQMLCNKTLNQKMIKLVLIENNNSNELLIKNETYQIDTYLNQLNCPFELFTDMTAVIQSEEYFRYNMVQVIIKIDTPNYTTFLNLLQPLSSLYDQCSFCSPLIIIVNVPISTIAHWTHLAFDRLNNTFRSEIYSLTTRDQWSKVYVRPTSSGCRLLNSVVVPNSTNDLKMFSIPFNRCDLNSTMLNVAVNNIFPYCSIRTDDANGKPIPHYFSVEISLLNMLQDRYNFRSNMIDARQQWGVKKNGKWNGMVEMIRNHVCLFIKNCCLFSY